MKMEQSVPKRRHIKFRRRGITQKKAYNIQDKRKFEIKKYYLISYLTRIIFLQFFKKKEI